MYSATAFEWDGGPLKNLPIPAFVTNEGQPSLLIETLSIGIRGGGRTNFMRIGFVMSNGRKVSGFADAVDFISWLMGQVGLNHWTYQNVSAKYTWTFHQNSGEPATEMMMTKYLLLLHFCGVETIPVPRIVEETFTGKNEDDHSPGVQIPYGAHLMKKCLEELRNNDIDAPEFP